jgi:multiple sugar transport system permease protein
MAQRSAQEYLDRFDSVSEEYGINLNHGILFILPTFLLLLGLFLYPTLRAIWLSLGTAPGQELFGIYASMFRAQWFRTVLQNSFVWIILGTILQLIVGFGLALLIHTTRMSGKQYIRGLFLLPWITPGVVVGLTFRWMYGPNFGITNSILKQAGLIQSSIGWLSDPSIALFAVMFAALWKRFPFVLIMTLAGLQSVDSQLYNAALLDGAPLHARLRHVVIPQLLPVLKVVILLSVIWNMNQFVIVFTMTGGGPVDATSIFAVEVYQQAFSQFNYQEASALAIVMLGIMIVFIAYYIRALRQRGVDL